MVARMKAEVPNQSCGSPLKKYKAVQANEPMSVNVFRKNILRPLKSAIPESRGDRHAMIIYEKETAKEYKAVFENENDPI